MKMKKWIALTAAFGMTVGAMTMSACGGKGGAENVDYTITIVDQDGDAVQGVSFAVLQGEKTVATLQTDENGVANGAMPAGDYTVSYTEMPSTDYDANSETAGMNIVTSFSISADDADVTLAIANYTLGTSFNPYTCYYATNEETGETEDTMTVPTVKANSDNYYVVARSADRTICISQADVTVYYSGTAYSAKDGDIEIQSLGQPGDFYYWAPIQIVNETDADIELVMTMKEQVVNIDDCTISIVDQDGAPVAGVEFSVMNGEETVATLTTDENGEAAVEGTMQTGTTYTVIYTQLPSTDYDANPDTAGIEIVTEFSLSADNHGATLVISNWSAGTSLNPHACYYQADEETGEMSETMYVPTVTAKSSDYYGITRSADKLICIQQADVTILYNGNLYSAKDGDIEILSQGEEDDFFYTAKLQIFNNTDGDIELIITLKDASAEA